MERVKEKRAENDSNRLFRFISENQGLTVEAIREKFDWSKGKTSRMLSVLERRGWIVRRVFSVAQPRMVVKRDEGAQLLSDRLARLVAWKGRLQARERDLFGKCVSAQMEGDSGKAKMYADQCAMVRRIVRLLAGTEEILSTLSTPGR
jgi:DNA-binding MarR family transcriptional regulator